MPKISTRRVTIDIPAAYHQGLKQVAFEQGTTVSTWMRLHLIAALKKDDPALFKMIQEDLYTDPHAPDWNTSTASVSNPSGAPPAC